MRRAIALFLVLAFVSSMFVGLVDVQRTSASPPSSTPPPAPRTRTEVAAGAYAIEAAAKAGAGRKTSTGECSGSPSNKGATDYYAGFSWSGVDYLFTGVQTIHLNNTPMSFAITGSCIDGNGLNGAFKVIDNSTSEIYEWDGVTAAFFDIEDSTLTNAVSFLLHQNYGGNYRVGATITTLRNDTISDFDTFSRSTGAVERTRFSAIEDMTVSSYNRDDLSYGAFIQQAQSTTLGYGVNRTAFVNEAASAGSVFVPKDSCYASSQLSGTFAASYACDNDDSNNWISAGTSNEYVVVNLTKKFTVNTVYVNLGNYPFAGHIDTWDGAAWTSRVTFMEPGLNTNTTYSLSPAIDTDKIRVFGTTTTHAFMGVHEIWIRGIELAPTTGSAAGNDLRWAIGNTFEGGFLQISFGADFEHGVSPNFGSPTEFVNWSGNYANDSRHTVFGLYGTGTGEFSLHLGKNAYASVIGNYVNNSRYIPYQFSGNQTGLRIIGNYIRGPIPWPGGIPTFEIAILVGGQDHDVIVSGNSLWDMDSTRIVGIAIGFASYNITIASNIIYDVGGNAIQVTGMDLKYKAESNSTVASDYSWKGNTILIQDNYIAGGTNARAIQIDSGYVRFVRNAVVDPPAAGIFDIEDGWGCHPNCSYAWVDWIDGFPDIPTVRWPVGLNPIFENDFWLRTGRTGTLNVSGNLTVNITSSYPLGFGTLQTPRCVLPGAGTFGHTTTDAEVARWSGHTCGPIEDVTSYVGPGILMAFEPERFYNTTLSISFVPIGTANETTRLIVFEVGSLRNLANTTGAWLIKPGHAYKIFIGSTAAEKVVEGATNAVFFFAFIMICILMVIGAVLARRRFGGSGV